MAGAEAHQGINLHTTDEAEGQPAGAATSKKIIFGAAATAGASSSREGQRDDPVRPSHLPATEHAWAVGSGVRSTNPAAASPVEVAVAGRANTFSGTPIPLDHASYVHPLGGCARSVVDPRTTLLRRKA